MRREYLRQGETIRALLLDIRETNKGPQLVLSRTHPDFVKALFALEVPEVFQGIVEIRAIAREPGSRSKIAVWSRDQHVDPVGACVGLKGSRVQAVVSELGGERIDIVPWTDEPREFIAQALSPAQVYKITLQEPGGADDSGLFAESLSSAMKSRARFRGPTAAPAPALGMSAGARHEFETRLTMIMREDVPCRLPLAVMVAVGFLALTALPTWSRADDQASKKSEPNEVWLVFDPAADGEPPADTDREARLRRLEKQLQDLLTEVRALKAARSAQGLSNRKAASSSSCLSFRVT